MSAGATVCQQTGKVVTDRHLSVSCVFSHKDKERLGRALKAPTYKIRSCCTAEEQVWTISLHHFYFAFHLRDDVGVLRLTLDHSKVVGRGKALDRSAVVI